MRQTGSIDTFLSDQTDYFLDFLSFDCITFNNFLSQEFIKIKAERKKARKEAKNGMKSSKKRLEAELSNIKKSARHNEE